MGFSCFLIVEIENNVGKISNGGTKIYGVTNRVGKKTSFLYFIDRKKGDRSI